MDRMYTVYGPYGQMTYNGIDRHPTGSAYELRVQEVTFYCSRNLELAICEAARYAKEQYNWPLQVVVTIVDPQRVYGY